MKGLEADEVAVLAGVRDPELTHELHEVAGRVKTAIYGNRMVLFAPLYFSNLCSNECTYCAFRARNKAIVRRALTQDEGEGFTQILSDAKTGKIIGAQIVGPSAAELIHIPLLAIHAGMTAGQVAKIVFAHPTVSETIKDSLNK